MGASVLLPGDEVPITDTDERLERFRGDVDMVIDAGSFGIEPTTVLDLTGRCPVGAARGQGQCGGLSVIKKYRVCGHAIRCIYGRF